MKRYPYRMVRGGWYQSVSIFLRAQYREQGEPDGKGFGGYGIRLARPAR